MTTPPRARDAVVPLVLTALPIVLGALAVRAAHAGMDVPTTAATLLVVIRGPGGAAARPTPARRDRPAGPRPDGHRLGPPRAAVERTPGLTNRAQPARSAVGRTPRSRRNAAESANGLAYAHPVGDGGDA